MAMRRCCCRSLIDSDCAAAIYIALAGAGPTGGRPLGEEFDEDIVGGSRAAGSSDAGYPQTIPAPAVTSPAPADAAPTPRLPDDLNLLVGKNVIVGRLPLCVPNSYTANLAYAGKPATVVSYTPNAALAGEMLLT